MPAIVRDARSDDAAAPPVAALVLIGAPGSGKSSVLDALATQLEIAGTRYGAIESEQLGWGSPPLTASASACQLEAVLSLQRAAGRRRFLVAATTESAEELDALLQATRAELALVVCLRAPAETVAERLTEREPEDWPGKQPLIARARRLAGTMPRLDRVDLVADTDASDASSVAAQVCEAMHTHGLLRARYG